MTYRVQYLGRLTFFQKASANGLELDASKQGIQYGEL